MQESLSNDDDSVVDNDNNVEEYPEVSPEDVVNHSYFNNTNILVTSLDEADEYTTIAYKNNKPIKSTLLLSTLLGSRKILGKAKYRKLTIPNVFSINDMIIEYYNEVDSTHKSIDNEEIKKTQLPSLKELLALNKDGFKEFVGKLCEYYEGYNDFTISAIDSLIKNKFYRIKSTLIFVLSEDLYLAIDSDVDLLTGLLLDLKGLKILIGDKM